MEGRKRLFELCSGWKPQLTACRSSDVIAGIDHFALGRLHTLSESAARLNARPAGRRTAMPHPATALAAAAAASFSRRVGRSDSRTRGRAQLHRACSTALLALVLTACAASGDGEKAARARVFNVVVGTNATWTAPRVLVTGAAKVGGDSGPADPASLAIARARGSHPSTLNAEALSMTVHGGAMDVNFNPVSIAERAFDLSGAETDGLEGLAHSMISAGREMQDYARFGWWETAKGDDLVASSVVPAVTDRARATPGGPVLTLDTSSTIGVTAGVEVERVGDFGVITGDIAVSANVASASIDRAINGAITPAGVDQRPPEAGATLLESTAQSGLHGTVDLTGRASRQAAESDPFAGRFSAMGATPRASGWTNTGGDRTGSIGAKRKAALPL